jgi:hypothetical protein
MALKGKRELNARLKSIKLAFKPIGKRWADEDVKQNRRRVPRKTGRLQDSFRVKNATQRKARVVGHYTASFIDAGTKAHDEKAKRARGMVFEAGGRTIFTKKVHKRAQGPQRFKRAAAIEALRLNPMAEEVIKQWNEAA